MQLVAVFFWVVPGPLSVDETVYHRMVQNLVSGNGLTLWNGTEEFDTGELTNIFISREIGTGRLSAQYPYGFPVIATPAYILFGYRGLFLVNALAMLGVVALTYRLALAMFEDRRLATGSVAILIGATYAWEYGMAAWPHATMLLFVMAGALKLFRALQATASSREALRAAAFAGLWFGIGGTMRLDGYLCAAPALLFLFARPARVRELVFVGIGLLPAFLFGSITNYLRWKTLGPFHYGFHGGLLAQYAPPVAVALFLLVAGWWGTLPATRAHFAAKRSLYLSLLAGAFILLYLSPLGARIGQLLRGMLSLGIDIQLLPEHVGSSGRRLEGGAIWQWGQLKKAVLQSCPFFLALLLPFYDLLRRPEHRRELALLFFIPAVLLGFFGLRSWHGGLSLNIRYFLPALPFLSIAMAYTVRALGRLADSRWPLYAGIAGSCTLVFYWLFIPPPKQPLAAVTFHLTVPLFLCALVLAATFAVLVRPGKWQATVATILLGVTFAWGGATAWTYDAPWSQYLRETRTRTAERASSHISDDCLVVTDRGDYFYGLSEYRPRVRVALGPRDDWQDAWPLIRFHQTRGRKVFGILDQAGWERLGIQPARGSIAIGNFILAEIH